jgi:hypothetical protein
MRPTTALDPASVEPLHHLAAWPDTLQQRWKTRWDRPHHDTTRLRWTDP